MKIVSFITGFIIGFIIGVLAWSITTDIAKHEMRIDITEMEDVDEQIIEVIRLQQIRIDNIENHLIYFADDFMDSLDAEIETLIIQ